MSSVKAMKAKAHGAKKGKIKHIRIEPAAKKGTFISHLSREHVPSPHGMYMGDSEGDKPTAHPSMSHLVKHVKDTFGEGDMGDPEENSEPAEA